MYEAGLLHGGWRGKSDATQSQMLQLLPMGCPYSINRLKTDPIIGWRQKGRPPNPLWSKEFRRSLFASWWAH